MGAFNVETQVHSYPGYGGYICSNNQICLEDQANNPDFGFVNYDNILYALLAVYTAMSLELWTEIMYQNQDADSNAAALFYCLVVYVISFLLIVLIFGKYYTIVSELSSITCTRFINREFLLN